MTEAKRRNVLKELAHTPVLTLHAQQRWAERCAGIDLDLEWLQSKRLGAKSRKKLRLLCPGHAKYAGRKFEGYWYAKGPSGVVFVIGGTPPQIITVWRWVN